MDLNDLAQNGRRGDPSIEQEREQRTATAESQPASAATGPVCGGRADGAVSRRDEK